MDVYANSINKILERKIGCVKILLKLKRQSGQDRKSNFRVDPNVTVEVDAFCLSLGSVFKFFDRWKPNSKTLMTN